MNYYHMTSLNNLDSISKKGLIPGSGANSKLIGDDKIRAGYVKLTDEGIMQKIMKSKSFSDYLGEGVYLRFDGTNIKNERNFENGCTDMAIPPEDLTVCVLQRKNDHSIVFSRFEIIKYMMSTVQPEQIQYYGAKYDGSPDFEKATCRIREKVRMYYENHQTEIMGYDTDAYQFVLYGLSDFVEKMQGLNESTKFKVKQAQIRQAVEAMLSDSEDVAEGKGDFETYDDVFGTED